MRFLCMVIVLLFIINHPLHVTDGEGKKEGNMRLSDFKAGAILVDGDGKVFIHDGFINADGYGVIIGEDSDGMIQKSNGIGNWMKEGFCREATSQEITDFFAKVRKTQKIINY